MGIDDIPSHAAVVPGSAHESFRREVSKWASWKNLIGSMREISSGSLGLLRRTRTRRKADVRILV